MVLENKCGANAVLPKVAIHYSHVPSLHAGIYKYSQRRMTKHKPWHVAWLLLVRLCWHSHVRLTRLAWPQLVLLATASATCPRRTELAIMSVFGDFAFVAAVTSCNHTWPPLCLSGRWCQKVDVQVEKFVLGKMSQVVCLFFITWTNWAVEHSVLFWLQFVSMN